MSCEPKERVKQIVGLSRREIKFCNELKNTKVLFRVAPRNQTDRTEVNANIKVGIKNVAGKLGHKKITTKNQLEPSKFVVKPGESSTYHCFSKEPVYVSAFTYKNDGWNNVHFEKKTMSYTTHTSFSFQKKHYHCIIRTKNSQNKATPAGKSPVPPAKKKAAPAVPSKPAAYSLGDTIKVVPSSYVLMEASRIGLGKLCFVKRTDGRWSFAKLQKKKGGDLVFCVGGENIKTLTSSIKVRAHTNKK